jgi:D-alanyl-D-alanine carboxypeptidase
VLQQIDEGLYSLSDTLGSVLSGNKDYEALDKDVINPDVTIEQILTMTSGIRNVTDNYRPEYTELQGSQNWRPVDVVRLVIAEFGPPGTYEYSNTNSMLLGLIAEHAGRQQLNELYKSALFDPLGIVAVLLPQDAPPPDTARPHDDRSQWGGTGFGDIMDISHHGADWYLATGKTSWAAAGIITTPENMARWAYELLSDQGSALSPTARARLLDSFTGPLIAIGGSQPEHLYGYHVTRTTLTLSNNPITAYGHPGGGGGYVSDLFYSPELDISISVLVNSHSDVRSRAEAQGKITHRILGEIAQQIFEATSQ